MSKAEEVEIEVTIKSKTQMAVLVNDGTKDVWLPISQINDWSGFDDFEDLDMAELPLLNVELFIPEWLAVEKGLV